MNKMHWVDRKITKEQYEEAMSHEDSYAEQRKLAENIAGMEIVCGYGLYGFSFKKRIVEGEEQYILSMHIGNSCD